MTTHHDVSAGSQAGPGSFSSPPDVESSAPFMPNVRLDFGAVSDTGKVRVNNQDAYIVCRLGRTLDRILSNLPDSELPPNIGEFGHIIMVADGMGGAAAGAVARHTPRHSTL